MLIVKAPLLTDKVCEVLDGYVQDGVTIRLLNRKGMELEFEMTGKSGFDAVGLAKEIVRSHDFGNALYFSAIWRD